jgi:Protein of unknown function (DUF642)
MLAILLGVATSSVNAAVLFSDNFNSEHGGVGCLNYGTPGLTCWGAGGSTFSGTSFTNWTVIGGATGGSVDLIGNGFDNITPAPGDGLYVDLDGSNNNAGGLLSKQSFLLQPGFTYTLSFSLANNWVGGAATWNNFIKVAAGSAFSQTYNIVGQPASATTYSPTFSVSVPTTVQLSFADPNAGVSGDNYGILLDNISLSSASIPTTGTTGTTGTPEPSTFMLLLAGAPLLSRRVRSVLKLER